MNKTLLIFVVLAVAYFVLVKKPAKTTNLPVAPDGTVPNQGNTSVPVITSFGSDAWNMIGQLSGVQSTVPGALPPQSIVQQIVFNPPTITPNVAALGQLSVMSNDIAPLIAPTITAAPTVTQTNAPQSAVALKSTLVRQPITSIPLRFPLQAVPFTTA